MMTADALRDELRVILTASDSPDREALAKIAAQWMDGREDDIPATFNEFNLVMAGLVEELNLRRH